MAPPRFGQKCETASAKAGCKPCTTAFTVHCGTALSDNSTPASMVCFEWYAMLLYSKKGAPISCTVNTYAVVGDCHVTSCTLP